MAPKTAKKTLFDDSEDESDGGAHIKVNEEYAKRFEHNKKREERQRCKTSCPPPLSPPAVAARFRARACR